MDVVVGGAPMIRTSCSLEVVDLPTPRLTTLRILDGEDQTTPALSPQ